MLIPVCAVLAVAASAGLQLGGATGRRLIAVAAVAGAVAVAAGPAAYSIASVGRSLSGNNVLAGPASVGSMGGVGGGPGGSGGSRSAGGPPSAGARPSAPPGGTRTGGAPTGGGGMGGGSLSTEVIAYLRAHQGSAKYLLAANGSQTTAGIIIATGEPVITIGGFNGADPAPTVAQHAKLVASGQVKYVLVGSGGGAPGGSSASIATWVKAHGTKVTAVTASSGTLYRVSA